MYAKTTQNPKQTKYIEEISIFDDMDSMFLFLCAFGFVVKTLNDLHNGKKKKKRRNKWI